MQDTAFTGYDMVEQLAQQLDDLQKNGTRSVYKAMLDAAPNDLTLEQAVSLTQHTSKFSVLREASSPSHYAHTRRDIPLKDELLCGLYLYDYGRQLMKHEHAMQTSEGVLRPLKGFTVEQCMERNTPAQTMEMKLQM